MRLLWLASELRAAGLTVVEHFGWQDRVRAGDWAPRYGVVHATAAPRTQSDETQVRIVRDGREDLPGPIAVACVDRTARWHVLGAGRCNTTITGTAGPFEGLGNAYALGVEACNDNLTEAWPAPQYRAYVVGWAAICARLGWGAGRLVGHKEHTPGHKTDPTFNMDKFRGDVTAALAGRYPLTPPQPSGDNMLGFVRSTDPALPQVYVGDGITRRPVDEQDIADIRYLAKEGWLGPLAFGGNIRSAANVDTFGALAEAVRLSDEQAEKIAAQLVAAANVPLGEADKPAIIAAVKQALAEGVA